MEFDERREESMLILIIDHMKPYEANVAFLDVPPFFYLDHCILSQDQ